MADDNPSQETRDATRLSLTEKRLEREKEIRDKINRMLALSKELQKMSLPVSVKKIFLNVDGNLYNILNQIEAALDNVPKL